MFRYVFEKNHILSRDKPHHVIGIYLGTLVILSKIQAKTRFIPCIQTNHTPKCPFDYCYVGNKNTFQYDR